MKIETLINKLTNYIILFVVFGVSLLSCGDRTEININSNPDNQSNLLNGKINVGVRVCENLFCTASKDLPDIEVKLKRDDSETFYREAITDEFGEISFSSINVPTLTVIAEYEGQEFQEKISVGRNEVLHIDILFSPFCELEGSQLVDCNTKIDFEHMSVGQVSKYAMYKTNVKQLNDDKSFYYTGDTLVFEVVEQVNDTDWKVEEKFLSETHDSIFEYIINTVPTTSIWEVYPDYFNIIPTPGNKPSNFTPLLTFDYESYKIPFVASGMNYCEMDQWYPLDCDYEGTPRFTGLEINGENYNEELILDRRSGIDIPQLGVLYSKNEGIVHTYTFGTMQYTYAYGFDLINE